MTDQDLFGVLHIINSTTKLEGRKRIQKIICISKYNPEIGYPFSFVYTPYLYGPYSFELKEIIDRLVMLGVIIEESNDGHYDYSLTSSGKKYLKDLSKRVEKGNRDKLNILISKYSETPTTQLVIESKKFFH